MGFTGSMTTTPTAGPAAGSAAGRSTPVCGCAMKASSAMSSRRELTPIDDLYRHVAELERELAELHQQLLTLTRRVEDQDRILGILERQWGRDGRTTGL
jgi:hypothetical protein